MGSSLAHDQSLCQVWFSTFCSTDYKTILWTYKINLHSHELYFTAQVTVVDQKFGLQLVWKEYTWKWAHDTSLLKWSISFYWYEFPYKRRMYVCATKLHLSAQSLCGLIGLILNVSVTCLVSGEVLKHFNSTLRDNK